MKSNKGIILAGGLGTRLNPFTDYMSKHMLPVYEKPMIVYPLSILLYSGIKNILIITNPEYIEVFKKFLSPIEKRWKAKFSYKIQENSKGGIAEAFTVGQDFIQNANKIILILGDNFFYGRDLTNIVRSTLAKNNNKSWIFLCPVKDPSNYGIAYLNKQNKLQKLIEKPKNNKSNLAITGIYIYSSNMLKYIKNLKRSKRNELEISSLNKLILKNNKLDYIYLGRGITWFDMGTFESLMETSEFVKMIQNKQGLKIADI
tara:strand:- start:13871 stop:14647 length:777 start_codon:yes stop_codon:yes gene_type:complete